MVLKLPLTPDAERSTTDHRQVVITLHQLPELHSFCAFVPRPISWGDYAGSPILPGNGACRASARLIWCAIKLEPASMKQDAARLIRQLHLGTLQRHVVDEGAFARLAATIWRCCGSLPSAGPRPRCCAKSSNCSKSCCATRLHGRELPFCWTHGDFWPGNLLLQPADGAIGGIIDWDRASADQIPLHDLLHLLAYTRKLQRRTELGEEIVSYLLPAAFDKHERALVKEAIEQLEPTHERRVFSGDHPACTGCVSPRPICRATRHSSAIAAG